MNIIVPSIPKRLQITEGMVEDFIYDPMLGIWVFFRLKLDAFQAVRLRLAWFTPNFEDSSGFSSAKTIVGWCFVQMRALLMEKHTAMVIYPTFAAGKENFWKYYKDISTPLWQAQLGKLDLEGEEEGKANSKEPAAWKQHFKNGSVVIMPAPNLVNESRSLAGMRTNTLYIDELNKVYATAGGAAGVQQILGRNTKASFNKRHPVWCNHLYTSSTAELSDHPGAKRHKNNEKEVKRGNPKYVQVSFCYKDYSNLEVEPGISFREKFRDDDAIKNLRTELSEEKFRAEVLGSWSGHSKGWYTQEMVDAARSVGIARKLEPEVVARRSLVKLGNGEQPTEIVYSLGVDSAPSQQAGSDDGTMAIHRAMLHPGMSGENESDWQQDYVYARRLRAADVDEWAGVIHEKHSDFGFDIIVMDHGGGGQWISPALKRPRQKIRGVWRDVRPIVARHTTDLAGQPLYVLFARGEQDFKGPEGIWEEQLCHARGDNVLKDLANTEFRNAFEKGWLGLPIEHNLRKKEEMTQWSEEKLWASKCLTVLGDQLTKYKVQTDEQGNWVIRNGSKFFFSEGKDDLHDACRNAYIGFKIYLLSRAVGLQYAGESDSRCGAW